MEHALHDLIFAVPQLLADKLCQAHTPLTGRTSSSPGDGDSGRTPGGKRRHSVDSVLEVERTRLGERGKELKRVRGLSGAGGIGTWWAGHVGWVG